MNGSIAPLLVLGFFSCFTVTQAAPPPDAGQILEGLRQPPRQPPAPAEGALPEEQAARPALKLPEDIRVRVAAIRISGARAFSGQELQALVQDAVGQELSLAALQGVAERLTRHYREHGYLLARAYLPAQEIEDGRIELAVLEGRLGRLGIDNRSLLSDAAVARQLAGIEEGQPLEAVPLERSLLLLNDLAGTELKSSLKPGASVGTSDLDIQVRGEKRFVPDFSVDNFGNPFSGAIRGGIGLGVNSPLGAGDALNLRFLTAGDGFYFGRAAYQAPIGSFGTKLGAAWSEMRYQLGEDFVSLQAHGSAAIGGFYAIQPILRSRTGNLNFLANYDHKSLDDLLDSVQIASRHAIDVGNLGLSGDYSDRLGGGGFTYGNAGYSVGHLASDSASAVIDAAGHRTQGGYDKWSWQLARIQRITDSFNLYGQFSGQWAGKNLNSSEKMILGGVYGVRAYPQGEAPADDAWLATVELRYSPAPSWRISGFYDAAEGRLNHNPLAVDVRNTRRLAGYGVGLSYSLPENLGLSATLAWRDSEKPNSDNDRSPRFWLQAVKSF